MSDNNLDEQLLRKQEQAKFFTEQSDLFGNDVSDISLADSVYIDKKMRIEGEKAKEELERYQRERDAKVETEKSMYISEIGLRITELDHKRERMDENNKLAQDSVMGIEANKVRIKETKHARMLDKKVRQSGPLTQEEMKRKQENAEKIATFSSRVSNVDGTGNFDTVKNAYSTLMQKITIMDGNRSEITMEMANELQQIYESTLAGAREYVDSHSIWKFKAISPWGIGRKRKNMAAEMVRELETGSLHALIKSLVPWIDEKRKEKEKSAEELRRESEIEELDEQIIIRDVVDKDLRQATDKNKASRTKITAEIEKHTADIQETDEKLREVSEKLEKIKKKQAQSRKKYEKKYDELDAEMKKNLDSKVIKDYEKLRQRRDDEYRKKEDLESSLAEDAEYIKKLAAMRDEKIDDLSEKSELEEALGIVEKNATQKVLEGDAESVKYLNEKKLWTEKLNAHLGKRKEEEEKESAGIRASLVTGWKADITLKDLLKSEELMHAVYMYGRSMNMSSDNLLEIMSDWDIDLEEAYRKDFEKWAGDLRIRALETFANPEWLNAQKTDIAQLIEKVNGKLGDAATGNDDMFLELYDQDINKYYQKKYASQDDDGSVFIQSMDGEKLEDRIIREECMREIKTRETLIENRKNELKGEIEDAIKAEMNTDKYYLSKKKMFENARKEIAQKYEEKILAVKTTIKENKEMMEESEQIIRAIDDEIEQLQQERKEIMDKNRGLEEQKTMLEKEDYQERYKNDEEARKESKEIDKLNEKLANATKSRNDKYIKRDLDDDELNRKTKRSKVRKDAIDKSIEFLENKTGVKKKKKSK